jgi:transposase
LFGWLREARKSPEAPTTFVPVVIEPVEASPVAATPKKRRKRSAPGGIEVEIDGVTVRIGRGAETRTVAAVIQALKAGR